ncbi:hypothetical protein J2T57_001327 [Natronocella acetinitrilica]|uniref:Uncharacterized protein n=1 Tax=Natronocella acetinitrilica TaxID=414046 RepID=A0AAE3KAF3_9GAMM|nr:hypothetical protein [Natronocella acetinitrilica]MCP1674225.1 hypothetical protein [Natronocella acetinitrilica]
MTRAHRIIQLILAATALPTLALSSLAGITLAAAIDLEARLRARHRASRLPGALREHWIAPATMLTATLAFPLLGGLTPVLLVAGFAAHYMRLAYRVAADRFF